MCPRAEPVFDPPSTFHATFEQRYAVISLVVYFLSCRTVLNLV